MTVRYEFPYGDWFVSRMVYCPKCNYAEHQMYGRSNYPGNRCECGTAWEIIEPPTTVSSHAGEIVIYKARRRLPPCNLFP